MIPSAPSRFVLRHLSTLASLAGLATTCLGCATTSADQEQTGWRISHGKPQQIDRGPTSYESEIGGLSEDDMVRAFFELGKDVKRCARDSPARALLGGQLELSLRIKRDGTLKWVHMPTTTLGDRAVERCIIAAAESREWPKPKSGEGVATHSYDVDAVEETEDWDPRRLSSVMGSIRKKTWPCLKQHRGHFVATLYVAKDGQVAAAGVSTPDHESEEAADCVADALQKLRFGKPKGVAKVTFELR